MRRSSTSSRRSPPSSRCWTSWATPSSSGPPCGPPSAFSPSGPDMGLRLFVVRHAQTDWNRERRYQGWQDSPLSEVGRGQAAAVARALQDGKLDAVYSSPLRRAVTTAEAIAAPHGLPVRVEEAFREIGF